MKTLLAELPTPKVRIDTNCSWEVRVYATLAIASSSSDNFDKVCQACHWRPKK